MSKLRLGIFLVCVCLHAQGTKINLQTQATNVNFSAQPFTIPLVVGATLPTNCTVGALYFLVSAASGRNVAMCVALNTWVLSSGPTTGGVPLKGNGSGGFASAVSGDIINLFSGCTSSTQYLGADGACHTAGGGGGGGTVTVAGGGSLTANALVTGAGASVVQTPDNAATLDSSGNIKVLTLTTGSGLTSVTPGSAGFWQCGEGTAPSTVSGSDNMYCDSSQHAFMSSLNGGSTYFRVPQAIFNGQQALSTSPIATGSCTLTTVSVSGALATDSLVAQVAGDPTSVTGYAPSTNGFLVIWDWMSSGQINIKQCNPTSSSITPGALSLTLGVYR